MWRWSWHTKDTPSRDDSSEAVDDDVVEPIHSIGPATDHFCDWKSKSYYGYICKRTIGIDSEMTLLVGWWYLVESVLKWEELLPPLSRPLMYKRYSSLTSSVSVTSFVFVNYCKLVAKSDYIWTYQLGVTVAICKVKNPKMIWPSNN